MVSLLTMRNSQRSYSAVLLKIRAMFKPISLVSVDFLMVL